VTHTFFSPEAWSLLPLLTGNVATYLWIDGRR